MTRKYCIATGASRTAAKWHNKTVTWEELTERFRVPTVTSETQQQYFKMDQEEQGRLKDVGGFVGGYLKDGKRKSVNVLKRSVVSLDADYAHPELWDNILKSFGHKAALYTTRKHTKDKPRFRVIIPLSRDVTAEEYEPLARMIAKKLGIDCFDDTTYQVARLMYWPSISHGADFKYGECKGDILNPDEILNEYVNWKDCSSWPVSERELNISRKRADKMEDPTLKSGLIGQFCRAYDIHDAIAKFLPDIYVPVEGADTQRYSYVNGTTSGGLVVYDNGLFAYSNHATDPISGREVNAFDLVRIHLYGDDDREGVRPEKQASFKKMIDMAAKDPRVIKIITEDANRDFDDGKDYSNSAAGPGTMSKEDYRKEVDRRSALMPYTVDSKGRIEPTIENVVRMLKVFPDFDIVRNDVIWNTVTVEGELPWKREPGNWRDSDDAQLRRFIKTRMPKATDKAIMDAFECLISERYYDPMKEWAEALPEWDGVKRLETLFIDTLGAEDDAYGYTRAVTAKSLVAVIRRVLFPGCKHDTMLILNGKQGIGKSKILQRLGGRWCTDSVSLADFQNGKAGVEKLKGNMIVEIAELNGLRKIESNVLKNVITATDDMFREAYAQHTVSHPRRCVFFGTTNEEDNGYLKDPTGNRRFLDLRVSGENVKIHPWELTDEYISQVWAEARVLALDEEYTTYLTGDIAGVARSIQEAAIEADPRQAMVERYLNTPLPDKWYTLSVEARQRWFMEETHDSYIAESQQRNMVCAQEIWVECFGQPLQKMKRQNSLEIINILTRIEGWRRGNKIWMEKTPEGRKNGYGSQRVFLRESANM